MAIATAPARAPAVGAPIHAALIMVQLFFASLSVAGKIVLRELSPMALAAGRVSLAALVFLAVWAAIGRERVALADLGRIAVAALLGIVLNQLLFLSGLARTTATNAIVLGASIPVFTTGVALLLKRERATRYKLTGLALALGGTLAITGLSRFDAGSGGLVGNLLILGNSLAYAFYLVTSRGLFMRLAPLTVITFAFLFGAIGIVPFGVIELVHAAPSVHARTWAWLVYIALFPTVGAYLLNALALRAAPASLVAVYIYIQPAVGALLAWSILGERLHPATGAGAVLIFAGIWLATLDARRDRRATSS